MTPRSRATAVATYDSGEYRITIEPHERRLRAVFNGKTIADSVRALALRETRHSPVYYFPRDDVRMDLLVPSLRRSHCPFRGNASYWSLEVGDRRAEDAAWSYEEPYQDAEHIRGHIAFYSERLDAMYEDEVETGPAAAESGALDANPLVPWLVREAWQAGSVSDLVAGFVEAALSGGIPLQRLAVVIRTLHPQLTGASYIWHHESDAVRESFVAHEILQTDQYLNSPLVPIFNGAGGIRRRLDGPDPQLDFAILRELREQGATDYVAMPLLFSNNQINALTITTQHAGGFTTEHLGHIYETLPLLSRLLEVHALRYTAVTLLETYLGRHSGRRVLNGHVRRGDGDNIHAVIWFCDLRESTPLADSMPRDAFLLLLNRFFDCVAGAVLDHGGEVLRFIGDAALAIFPIEDRPPSDTDAPDEAVPSPTARACADALAAAREARRRIEVENARRRAAHQPPLQFGIALHVGDVTYGNIGTPSRLEFTVIGTAANEAARIEALSKTLDEPILLSAEFVRQFPGAYVNLGTHRLRGVGASQEVFAPPPP